MGCGASSTAVHALAKTEPEAHAVTKQIDQSLKKSAAVTSTISKLLLLGAGESGKSTLFKQMYLVYGRGFPVEERKNYLPIIRRNVIQAIRAICENCDFEHASASDSSSAAPPHPLAPEGAPFSDSAVSGSEPIVVPASEPEPAPAVPASPPLASDSAPLPAAAAGVIMTPPPPMHHGMPQGSALGLVPPSVAGARLPDRTSVSPPSVQSQASQLDPGSASGLSPAHVSPITLVDPPAPPSPGSARANGPDGPDSATAAAADPDSSQAQVQAQAQVHAQLPAEPTADVDRARLGEALSLVASLREEDAMLLGPSEADLISLVWTHPAAQRAFAGRYNRFHMSDSAAYFLDRAREVLSAGFVPSEQDILRSRVGTTGIVENEFSMGSSKVRMFDVGGQRNERKKWIHCFEGVTAVLFVAAISEYDQTLYEDENTNRLSESLELFDDICNSPWFTKTSMILFLNKRDVFQTKVELVPMSRFVPGYDPAHDGSYDHGVEYMKRLFVKRNKHPNKPVYTHVTCATDTNNVRAVFMIVKDIVIRKGLAESGLLG